MDFDVLPGPPLAEVARTTIARAIAATVACPGSRGIPPMPVPLRVGQAGLPILLPSAGSPLARHLEENGPAEVLVAVPADAPFSALRLSGVAVRSAPGFPVRLRRAEFTGPVPVQVALEEYAVAAPDPLWREAPGVLEHLERSHMAELVSCVRAHGLVSAEAVVPRALDRFGLQLLVLMPSGAAAVRLAFPDGPVRALHEAPASIRAALTCRCASGLPDSTPYGQEPKALLTGGDDHAEAGLARDHAVVGRPDAVERARFRHRPDPGKRGEPQGLPGAGENTVLARRGGLPLISKTFPVA